MKAIITVVGQDQVGIVAKVANELGFAAAKAALESLGEASELTIRIQRQAVFDAIQKLQEATMESRSILETIQMVAEENLDIRTITMGISLFDCVDSDGERSPL